jgi:hypothetical protein
MRETVVERIHVRPNIRLVHEYVRRIKFLSLHAVDPVFVESSRQVQSLMLKLEGSPQHLTAFRHLLQAANLQVS